MARMRISDDFMDAEAASSGISRAERRVRASMRWTVASMVLLGIATIGYLTVLGATAGHAGRSERAVLVVLPSVLFALLRGMRSRHPSLAGRRLQRLERSLGWVYVLLLLPAGIAAVLARGALAGALAGLVAALPCFAGAWRAAR